jgi:hypothetical protein
LRGANTLRAGGCIAQRVHVIKSSVSGESSMIPSLASSNCLQAREGEATFLSMIISEENNGRYVVAPLTDRFHKRFLIVSR